MFDAVCDKCGKDCKVPFQPSGDKPIYCSDCFEQMNGGSRNSRDSRDSDRSYQRDGGFKSTRPAYSVSPGCEGDLKAINAKLDRILKLLAPVEAEKSTSEKIIEEIEFNSGVEVKPAKKKAKKANKKKAE